MVYLHTHIHFGIVLEVTRSENEASGLKIPRVSSHRSHRRHERDQEQQRSITQVGNSSKLAITTPEKSEARDEHCKQTPAPASASSPASCVGDVVFGILLSLSPKPPDFEGSGFRLSYQSEKPCGPPALTS